MNKLAFLAAYLHKASEEDEQIKGGKADNKDTQEIAEKYEEADPKEIEQQKQKGTAVEMEHTDKPAVAEEVAEDHLEEIPDYYDRLGDMEDEAKIEKEKDLGDPSPVDKQMILKFIMTQPDLDDETLHNLYTSLGVDPHEGEEIVYSALQQYMQKNPSGLAPAYVKEREVEEGEEEESGEE